jgi:hypothetical protein
MLTRRRISSLAIVIALSSSVAAAAPTLAQAQTAPHLDANGWTVFTPSRDTRMIYVSSSTGNDSNSGLSKSRPIKSLRKGVSLLRNRYPDWLLLKKGDTWTSEGFGQIKVSGRSATEPMLISSYGTGARPRIETNFHYGINSMGGAGGREGGDRVAIAGLEFYQYRRDPVGNPNDFDINVAGKPLINFLNPITWLLIENCKFSFSNDALIITPLTAKNVTLRRNIVVDGWGLFPQGAQGILAQNIKSGFLIEENVFDHNGWNADTGDSRSNQTNRNHNMYLAADNGPITVRGNISANSSLNGIMDRAGGTVQDNLLLRNPIGIAVGSKYSDLTTVDRNVIMYGTDVVDSPLVTQVLGWGISVDTTGTRGGEKLSNIGPIAVTNNIIAHEISNGSSGSGIGIGRLQTQVTVANNIIVDWITSSNMGVRDLNGTNTLTNNTYVAGSDLSGHGWPDPSRTIETYDRDILGGPGTLDHFLSLARQQSKDHWNPALTAHAVNNYIRAGFGIQPTKSH